MKTKLTKLDYAKNDRINMYSLTGSGKHTRYVSELTVDDTNLLYYACSLKLAKHGNDAPRGGKLGEHFAILRKFNVEKLWAKKIRAEKKAKKEREEKLAKLCKSEKVCSFWTESDIGCFIINGEKFSNHDGDGLNTVEVCEVDFDEFKSAEYITRRQIYNSNSPITIVKYDAPRTITVADYDCRPNENLRKIDNVCGFAIWAAKLKIFIAK